MPLRLAKDVADAMLLKDDADEGDRRLAWGKVCVSAILVFVAAGGFDLLAGMFQPGQEPDPKPYIIIIPPGSPLSEEDADIWDQLRDDYRRQKKD